MTVLAPHTFRRGALSAGPGSFWIESLEPTGYRVSLVNVSESAIQNSSFPNSLQVMSTKSTISKKLEIATKTHELKNPFKTLHIFRDEKIKIQPFGEV